MEDYGKPAADYKKLAPADLVIQRLNMAQPFTKHLIFQQTVLRH